MYICNVKHRDNVHIYRIPTAREVRLSLAGMSILLSFCLWGLVDASYITSLFSSEQWNNTEEAIISIRDISLTIAVGTLISYVTFVYTEVISRIDDVWTASFPSLLVRHFLLFIINAITAFLVSFLLYSILHWERLIPTYNGLLVYTLIATVCSEVYLAIKYFVSIHLAREVENALRLKQTESENIILEERLAKIGMQIDNHFMHNSLGTLGVMIGKDSEGARTFCFALTECYRHLVLSTKCQLIPVKDELEFLYQYIKMMQYRFPECLAVYIQIDETDGEIPPLSLQGLVENAIKHNSFSQDFPLVIQVRRSGESITVTNCVRPLATPVESTGIGLKLIIQRYASFGETVKIVHGDDNYSVTIPIINSVKLYESGNN